MADPTDILLLITRPDGGVSHRVIVTRGRGSPPPGATWEYESEWISGEVAIAEAAVALDTENLAKVDDGTQEHIMLLAEIRANRAKLEVFQANRTGYWLLSPTDDELDASIQVKYPGATWRRIKLEDLPGRVGSIERDEYRSAWRDVDGVLTIDMGEARKLRLEALRRERAALWPIHDVDWKRAAGNAILNKVGAVDALRKLEAEAQALRDLPQLLEPALNAAKNVQELSAVRVEQALTAPASAPSEAAGRSPKSGS